MLVKVYGETDPTDKPDREWSQCFKFHDFSIEDKCCSRQTKNYKAKI